MTHKRLQLSEFQSRKSEVRSKNMTLRFLEYLELLLIVMQ